jgi:radical SAM superfamily enzyme YgiQ (UPF0313 family)
MIKLLLLTPPLVQLNTPYPATQYLKGYLDKINSTTFNNALSVEQRDPAIELVCRLFSKEGLQRIYEEILRQKNTKNYSWFTENINQYLRVIDNVIKFLQLKDSSFAYQIVKKGFLPQGPKTKKVLKELSKNNYLDFAFGTMSIHDKAKYFATLFIEDITELIQNAIDSNFSLSRYAEKLAASQMSFDLIQSKLNQEKTLVEKILDEIIEEYYFELKPDVVGISLPFPGNVVMGFRIVQKFKSLNKYIKTIAGGGFVNTELRILSEPRVFDYFDFITLDDGEKPLELILLNILKNKSKHKIFSAKFNPHEEGVLEPSTAHFLEPQLERSLEPHLEGSVETNNACFTESQSAPSLESNTSGFLELEANESFLRTFVRIDNKVKLLTSTKHHDVPFKDSGTPTTKGLKLDQYLSVLEMLNPMHRMWSDTRWNKLTLAHGCYWKKCSFCDIHLDYINRYDPAPIDLIIDRMIQISNETKSYGFHFVDEACPPALLKALSERLLQRGLNFTWWGNIRFDKYFTYEVTKLMSQAGCVAVTGGLEVASERILKLINKGVSIEQVKEVTKNFNRAGILVHAYLMYGFPTQTYKETVDSLRVVRDLFREGCIDSAYWHRFSATAHSEVGRNPDKYKIKILTKLKEPVFAYNDLEFYDSTNVNHDKLGKALNRALYNYMHGIGLDEDVEVWFHEKS